MYLCETGLQAACFPVRNIGKPRFELPSGAALPVGGSLPRRKRMTGTVSPRKKRKREARNRLRNPSRIKRGGAGEGLPDPSEGSSTAPPNEKSDVATKVVFSTASGESEKVFSAASVVPWKSLAEHRAAGQIAVITNVNPIKPQAETGNKTTEAKNRETATFQTGLLDIVAGLLRNR